MSMTNFLEESKKTPDLTKFKSYEEYLDHFVDDRDRYFLQGDHIARTIVTLGFKVPELLTEEEFLKVQIKLKEEREERKKDLISFAHKVPSDKFSCPLMQILALHETNNREGYESCIIYIRDFNRKGQEISGYIDFKHRLMKEDEKWKKYYTGELKLLPTASDLSFYNWTSFYSKSNSSSNYIIVVDVKKGLCFKHKYDRKIICVDPNQQTPGDNTIRHEINSPNYLQCLLFIHSMRSKV